MSCADKGLEQRPVTAPQLISSEIGALVEDILGTVATYATSSSSSSYVPRRPHTACAGARVAAVLEHKVCSDSDDESDGGSIDVDHESNLPTTSARPPIVRPTTSVQTSTSTKNTSFRGTTSNLSARPYTAPCERTMQACEESSSSAAVPRPSAHGEAEVLSLEHSVPEGEALLLTGGFWGRAACSYNSVTAQHEPAPKMPASLIPEALLPIKGPLPTLPQATAEKLPRRCLILSNGPNLGVSLSGDKRTTKGSGRGLMPQAARYKSHNSWSNFMPMRPSTGSVSASVTLQSTGDSTLVTQDTRLAVVETRTTDEEAAVSAQSVQAEARILEPKKPTGPKYRVLPGGSRPAVTAASLLADKAKQREFLVLEFRTEPRVVPAMRRNLSYEETGGMDVNAAVSKDAAAKVLVRSASGKKNRFTPSARFRKDSNQWALEREAIAGRAGF